ncbi:hypothetical protein Esti_002871 [Eimeria stiedai]
MDSDSCLSGASDYRSNGSSSSSSRDRSRSRAASKDGDESPSETSEVENDDFLQPDQEQVSDVEEFLWGRPSGAAAAATAAAGSDDELLEEADYVREGLTEATAEGVGGQRSRTSAAAASAAAAARSVLQQQRHGDVSLFDEEAPPYLLPVLLRDAAARMRKQQLLLAALNDLTHTEIRHDAAAAAAAAAVTAAAAARDALRPEDSRPLQQQQQRGRRSWGSETVASNFSRQQQQQPQQQQKASLQQQNPKLAKIIQSVFSKNKPVGRFGAFGQQQQQQQQSAAAAGDQAAGHGAGEGSEHAKPAGTAATAAAAAAAAAALQGVSTVELSLSPSALRNLKDANLLLKREGCSSDSSKQQQQLYEIEDGHLIYQHPRFCANSIFETGLVLRCLSPLWQRLCTLYDEFEAETQEQQQHYLLLLQLLRCLSSLATPPAAEWIKFWVKFSAVLDSSKAWQQKIKEADRAEKETGGRDRLSDLNPEERQAAQTLIENERRKRSHIVFKYLNGMQKMKETLCCGRLWLLLAKFYFDQTELLDQRGRNTASQREIDELTARRDALYSKEKELKDRLAERVEDTPEEDEGDSETADAKPSRGGGRLRRGGDKEEQRFKASLRAELAALREELFAVTESISAATRRLREAVDRAKAAVSSVQQFVCLALELPAVASEAAAGGVPPHVAARRQLKLVKSMLQHGVESKASCCWGGVLQQLLQDVQQQLFSQMQRQFDLEGSSHVSAEAPAAASEGGAAAAAAHAGGGDGKALGWWSVTSVHSELMAKIWRALRTVHAITASLPPLQFAAFLAQKQPEVVRALNLSSGSGKSSSSSISSTRSSSVREAEPRAYGSCHRRPYYPTWEQQQQEQQRQLLEWSRQDPLRARQLLQRQRKAELEKKHQRGVRQVQYFLPERFIDFPRLFGFTDLLLLPFDMEGGGLCGDGGEGDRGGDTDPGVSGAGETRAGTGLAAGSLDMSSSFCRGDWLYVGGEPLLEASEAHELHQLLAGFMGVSPLFSAPVDPVTHENAMYCGKHYSLAFLIEAAVKDKARQIEAEHHSPWDEELLLNLVSWTFAFNVSYFSAANAMRQRARMKQQQHKKEQQQQRQQQQRDDDLTTWQRRWAEQLEESTQQQQEEEEAELELLDRVDMIFCMQGFDTLLLHEFLLECLQKSVRVEKLKRSGTGLCVAALRCLRQLLRMMELHARSRTPEVRAAVRQQFERWIGSGIVSDLSYVLRRYKPRSTDPKAFLFAVECASSLLSLLQQLGGVVCANAEGFKVRRRRKNGAAAATTFWEEEDAEQQLPRMQQTRQVTIDDVRSDFFRGDIIGNCMSFLSRYKGNPLSVNAGVVCFLEDLMQFRGRPEENAALFFDLGFFITFQEMLNDPQVTLTPRWAFMGDFAAWVVKRFFCLWRSNRLLPVELLFSKQHAPQTFASCKAPTPAASEGDTSGDTSADAAAAAAAAATEAAMTKHDFWSPASLPALLSLCTNYSSGTDAKVLHQMQLLPHLLPEEAFKLAADEAAAASGVQSGAWSGGVWTHEEDCMLMQYFEQFRDVRDYYTYIADLMGRHPKAVRKRLMHLRQRQNEDADMGDDVDDPDEGLHGDAKNIDAIGEEDGVAAPGALAAAVLAFRKQNWRDVCAAAGDTGDGFLGNVTYDAEKLLHAVAAAVRDACRLRRQLEETHRFGAAAAAAGAAAAREDISVEEPTEAPMPVLDSPEFKALMKALCCSKGKGDAPWCLRWDRSQELLAAGVDHLEVLASRSVEDLEAEQERRRRSHQKQQQQQQQKKRSRFAFRSAALGAGLIDFQRRLLELRAATAVAGNGTLSEEDVEARKAAAAAAQKKPEEVLADLVRAFKALLQQMEASKQQQQQQQEQQQRVESSEERVLQLQALGWFEALASERPLRRLLWLMGLECSKGDGLWILPKDVSASIWRDRLAVFEAMHARSLDDLEMLVEDVRPREIAEHEEGGGGKRDRRQGGERKQQSKPTHRKGGDTGADQPVRLNTYPLKPTLQQQLLLVQKLVQWRRFVEDGLMGEVVGADEQLLNLISCLDTWLGRRAAAAAEAAAAAGSADASDESTAAAAAAAERAVGNLVVTQQGLAGDEEKRGSSSTGSLEALPTEALGQGRLPTTLQALWVCAALAGQPTVGSDNRRWIWLADPNHLPASWLRRQLKLLLRALTDPRLNTAAALQEEADELAKMLQQQQQQEQQREAEERRRQQEQQEREEREELRRRRRQRLRSKRKQAMQERNDAEDSEAAEETEAAESSFSESEAERDGSEAPTSPLPTRSGKKSRDRRRSRSASLGTVPVKREQVDNDVGREEPPLPATGESEAAAGQPTAAAAPEAAAAGAAAAVETDAFAAWIRDTIEQAGGVSSATGALPEALQEFIAETENHQQQQQQQQREEEGTDGIDSAEPAAADDVEQPAAAAAAAAEQQQQLGLRGKRARAAPSPEELKALLTDCYRIAESGVSSSSSSNSSSECSCSNTSRLDNAGAESKAARQWRQQQQQQRLYWTSSSLSCWPEQQQQQQQRRRRISGGPAALAAAGVAFCSVGGSKKREVRLGDVSDFPEGGTYEVAVNEGKDKVLVSHLNGSFYCTAATCPHYGALLAKGVAVDEHVTCPWHDAKFDVKTGKCLAGPVTQSIRTFPVSVKDSAVLANIPETFADEPLPICCFQRPETAFKDKTFVIVGGGPAAAAAAEELRAQGFQGRLIIISKEQLPPYDRIVLSKNLKCDAANIVLRPLEYFSNTLHADLRLGEKVELIDADARTLKTNKGEALLFVVGCLSQVLLCTGCTYRRLSGVKGSEAEGVFYVREMEDLQKFRDSLSSDVNTPESLSFVVVGSSFIGIEVAAALRKLGVREVSVVGQAVPFEGVLGPRIGGAFKNLLETNNVSFIPQAEVQEILTRDNKVIGVKLNSGRVLKADRVVVGIGAIPQVPEIKSSKPVKQGVRGGLSVDPFLKTPSYSDIFVAGDIASFPYIQSGEETRIEHYATAMDLGRSAAANMLELQQPYTGLPFFWTMVFGKGLRYVGNGHGHDDVIIEGDLEKMQFVAYYTKGDKSLQGGDDPTPRDVATIQF